MISFLSGILYEKNLPSLIIEVHGIGYEVIVSMNNVDALPNEGESIKLHTYFAVREDAQQLFGFLTKMERQLFLNLIKVNGIGPKLAITMLSSIDPIEFIRYIQANDYDRLLKIPGVGKKTAQRLVIEMKDRLDDFQNEYKVLPVTQKPQQEAITALIALGYKPQLARQMVSNVFEEGAQRETLIKRALQETTE